MTTSEPAPSLHLQCLKNCLSEKLPCGECPPDRIISDSGSSSILSSLPSDPTKSPTNNNNNNTTTVHLKCAQQQQQNTVCSQSENSFSSVSAPGVCGTTNLSSSSPCIINSTNTPVSNAGCTAAGGNQLSCNYNNCKSTSSSST